MMQAMDNLRLSFLGLDNGGLFQKKAHLLEAEQKANTGNAGLVLQDGLKQRQAFCDLVNSIWGLGIWCDISEVVEGIDKDGNGEISDQQDQSGAESGAQPENNDDGGDEDGI